MYFKTSIKSLNYTATHMKENRNKCCIRSSKCECSDALNETQKSQYVNGYIITWRRRAHWLVRRLYHSFALCQCHSIRASLHRTESCSCGGIVVFRCVFNFSSYICFSHYLLFCVTARVYEPKNMDKVNNQTNDA